MTIRFATQVAIVDTIRSPFGRYGGALSHIRPDDLLAELLIHLRQRYPQLPEVLDEIYIGCVNGAGEDNRNIARMAGLLAEYPVTVPAVTVNRLCGSGLDAVVQAARAIRLQEGKVYVAGGVESMSRAPWIMPKPEKAYPQGSRTLYDSALGWRMVNPKLEAMGHTDSLGQTAEHLAERFYISRLAQDQFAQQSQHKALEAQHQGLLAAEMMPIANVQQDECPRVSELGRMSQLPAVFQAGGTVTAANSSPLSDGAAVVLLANAGYAEAQGWPILGYLHSWAVAGVEPRYMGLGPVPASQKLLQAAGLTLADLDYIELNEAFAAQSLAVLQHWQLDPQDSRLNPLGGAIALGHPLGASGARLLATAARGLQRVAGEFALVSLCIGVGQGISALLSRSPHRP